MNASQERAARVARALEAAKRPEAPVRRCGEVCECQSGECAAWAKTSTCDRVVHGMPLDTPEWAARRALVGRRP